MRLVEKRVLSTALTTRQARVIKQVGKPHPCVKGAGALQPARAGGGGAGPDAFVILVLQLVADLTAIPSRAPVDRLIDITLGCGLSIVALWINGEVQQRLRRGARGGGRERAERIFLLCRSRQANSRGQASGADGIQMRWRRLGQGRRRDALLRRRSRRQRKGRAQSADGLLGQ